MREGEEIFERVFLLRMLTREADETIEDITASLANTGMFDIEYGNRLRERLEKESFIVGGELSLKGMLEAKKAETEFRL